MKSLMWIVVMIIWYSHHNYLWPVHVIGTTIFIKKSTLFIKGRKNVFFVNELHPQGIHVDQKIVNRELCANQQTVLE